MPPARLLLAAVALTAATLGAPALASAVPPQNDPYLASIPIDVATRPDSTTTVDTTEATTQTDMFSVNSMGQPLGGGPPEPTTCKGVPFGKTVWYDLAPPTNGGAQIRATAGFATAVALYEWNPADSRITRLVDCTTSAAQDLLPDLEGGKRYTIQLGGVAGAGGLATLSVTYFPDADGDGVLDALDDCPNLPGIPNSGCPPKVHGTPVLGFDRTGNGIRITRLVVDDVDKGAKVVAKCSGCGSQTVKAKRTGRVTLSKLVGRTVTAGRTVQVRITMAKHGTGRFRNGATGAYFKWPIKANGLGQRVSRCINARSGTLERCK